MSLKWLTLFALLPLLGATQSVKRNQYDPFLKRQTVELEPVTLVADGANRLALVFSAEAQDLYLQVRGAGWGATTVDEGDELRFLLANDSSAAVTSAALQSFEPGVERSTYRHVYRLPVQTLQALAKSDVTTLRKFSFKESSDLRLPRDQRNRLQAAATLFLSELKKAEAAKPLKPISAADVFEHVGDSVQFCSRVFNVRATSEGARRKLVLEAQADFSSPVVQLVADESLLGAEAQKTFLNKALCVKGLLLLQNGLPTVIVNTAAQLQLSSAAPGD